MTGKTKDFDRYAYFVSKAKNYAICYQPEMKEVDMYGQQREVKAPIRIEFHNGKKRIEKTPENQPYIDFLRERIKKEESMDPRSRTLWEEQPSQVVPKEEHEKSLQEKQKEIERLKKEMAEKEEQQENEQTSQKSKSKVQPDSKSK